MGLKYGFRTFCTCWLTLCGSEAGELPKGAGETEMPALLKGKGMLLPSCRQCCLNMNEKRMHGSIEHKHSLNIVNCYSCRQTLASIQLLSVPVSHFLIHVHEFASQSVVSDSLQPPRL